VGAAIDSPQDARAWADAIRQRAPGHVDQVVFVDDPARYGLRVHLDAEIEDVCLAPMAPPGDTAINPAYDEDAARELLDDPDPLHTVWVVQQVQWTQVQAYLHARDQRAVALGDPWSGRVFFRVESPSNP
jgi:hypothetical protein